MNLEASFSNWPRWSLSNETWFKGELHMDRYRQYKHKRDSCELLFKVTRSYSAVEHALVFSNMMPNISSHRIDANTDDIESNVAGAQTELLKYYSYVSSNRWLMVKVFAVIISSAVTLSVLS